MKMTAPDHIFWIHCATSVEHANREQTKYTAYATDIITDRMSAICGYQRARVARRTSRMIFVNARTIMSARMEKTRPAPETIEKR